MRKSWLALCFLLCLFLAGCAHLPWGGPRGDRRTQGEEGIDPLGHPQDQVIVTEQEPGGQTERTEDSSAQHRLPWKEEVEVDSLASREIYRVQFFATKYPDEASQVAEMVAGMLSEKTYIDYKTPYYWVRAGDCETRGEADALLRRVKQLGYEESWVVEEEIGP